MKVLLTRLAAFAGRHWLRIGLIGCALFLFSQKQVDLNISLGQPAGTPPPQRSAAEKLPLLLSREVAEVKESKAGFFSRFNIFGGGSEAPKSSRLAGRDVEVAAFVDRFGKVARAEQGKFGIPASVILAAGLLNSEAGSSAAAHHGNSFFALGCGDGWSGATMENNGRCVRGYDSAWLSFRDFSKTVTQGRFAKMKQFGPQDYRRWAAGLGELGLNNDAALAGDLVRVIDQFDLSRFDR